MTMTRAEVDEVLLHIGFAPQDLDAAPLTKAERATYAAPRRWPPSIATVGQARARLRLVCTRPVDPIHEAGDCA